MTDKLRDAAPLLPCPFCGDEGEKGTQTVTLMNAERTSFKRVSCRCCGATCPEPNWNHRAALAQQDAQAVPHEPVARLMKYVGKGTYPKKGYTVARTYEECPKVAYPNDWEEGPELHTHPSPTDLRAERELRRMLCIMYAGGHAYMDDGEAQDNRANPPIDFMRDSPEVIQQKIQQRSLYASPEKGKQ